MANVSQLLDFIAEPESGGNYNAYYGNARNQTTRFTDMTVGQVLDWQRRKSGPTPVGRYQFVRGTLEDQYASAGLELDDRFDEEAQDKLAVHLMRRRGLDEYMQGGLSAEEFGNRLAKEWAAMPLLSGPGKGDSYYAGDGVHSRAADAGGVLRATAVAAAFQTDADGGGARALFPSRPLLSGRRLTC